MKAALKILVKKRAGFRCEYCKLHRDHEPLFGFHIEHIRAKKHRGKDSSENLAFACYHCNLHKGPNLTGIDPLTERIVRLFHPRRLQWKRHFRWQGPILIGRTPIGRATIEVLQINQESRVKLRQRLIGLGLFP